MITKNFSLEENIGIFSDIHIGLGQNSSIWHENVLQFAEWVKDFYLSKNIHTLIIPGDIFHNRNEISVQTLNVANVFFEKLKDFNIIISTGNHDCYYKDRSDINSVSIFNNWPNIQVVDKNPVTVEAFDKKISFIPWGTSLDNIPNTDICFGHFEINSFKYNNYAVCEHGLTSADLLNKSRLIISGHFHTKDCREYSNGKIVYLGSPYQQNFGDTEEERGVYIFNIKSEKFTFFENKISPKHLKLSFKSFLEKKIPANFLSKNVPNNMICLLADTNDFTNQINIISSKIQELNPKFFRVDYKIDNVENLNSSNEENKYSHLNIIKSIEDFIENLSTPHKTEVLHFLQEKYNALLK